MCVHLQKIVLGGHMTLVAEKFDNRQNNIECQSALPSIGVDRQDTRHRTTNATADLTNKSTDVLYKNKGK
jgi:hypothetical protein